LNQLIIQFDLAKLPKDQNALAIILKDTMTNQYSNEQIIQIKDFSNLAITHIDIGK
jgi:hypothetical protein